MIDDSREGIMREYIVYKQELPNGETMAYRKSGNAQEVLFLIHGNQSSSYFYHDLLEEYEKDFTVYAIDLIGFGESSYNRQLNSLKDFSDDVYLFMQAMDIKSAHVLGWSTGGGVAMELAAAHPECVKQLILLDSVGVKGFSLYKYGVDFKPILTKRVFKREDVMQDPVSVVPVLSAFRTQNKLFIKKVWDSIIFNLNQPDPELYDHYLDEIMKERCLVDVVTSLVQFNITNDHNGVVDGSGRIDQIKCPVFIIHGELDLIVNVSLAYEMKEYFGERAKLYIMKNAGHSAFMDKPEEFKSIMNEILGR